MDLINRNEAIEAVDGKLGEFNANNKAVSILMHLPSVEPVRHGRWERLVGDSRFMCSVCKWKEDVPTCNGEPTIWDYCPSCGARMDGEQDADEITK